jgi:peptide/nickel transport system substrate-binding protein
MRKLRWQLLIALGGIILIIGLLLGQAPILESSAPRPVSGGVYAEGLIGTIRRLNPILDVHNQVDRSIDQLLYDSLVAFDSRALPVPELAESWSISADATLYTVSLRRDAVWHDGEPISSDDVIYTFSKLQDEDYPGPEDLHEFWQEVNIIRLDEHSVQFQLPEAYAPFLDYLSVGLLPDHLLRGVSAGELIDHPYNLQPVGTGPFVLDRFIQEQDGQITGVRLLAFKQYYGEGPFLERIEFAFFEGQDEALQAYYSGEIQGIGDVGSSIIDAVLLEPNLNLFSAPVPELTMVFLNNQHPEKDYFGEKEFRKALMMAINREWIINETLDGQAVIAVGPILPDSWSYSTALAPIPFDPEMAASTLTSLGWELPEGATPGTVEYQRTQDERTLGFELAYPDDPLFARTADLLAGSWERLGISVELIAVGADELMDEYLEPRQYEAVLTRLDLSRYPDPDPYPFWHDTQVDTGQNFAGFDDRNISLWLEGARTTPDIIQRTELYRNFQHRFQDQVPSLLLYYPVYNYAIDRQVQGVSIGPVLDPSQRFEDAAEWFLLARITVEEQEPPLAPTETP